MAESWKDDITKERLGGKRNWTDDERLKLCQSLDEDLNKHIDSLNSRSEASSKDQWTEENWKEKMSEHPLFAPYVHENDNDGKKPYLNDLSEGLAQLKYTPEHNTPLEIAQNYKEEGIYHFKFKKYRFAVTSFTEGIKANCRDDDLNAQLYNNRAAAHYFLKNYRSALQDCQKAVDLVPSYTKAMRRAIHSATLLQSWDEVLEWCEKALLVSPSEDEFVAMRKKAIVAKKKAERDKRKRSIERKKISEKEEELLQAITARNINICRSHSATANSEEPTERSFCMEDLDPVHPAAKDSPVHFDECGSLVWPVLFLYPEYRESDCILEFNENSSFADHIYMMFNADSPPAPWDLEKKYKPENLMIFFKRQNDLIEVSPQSTLKETLSDARYEVRTGTPNFNVVVRGSKFMKEYVAQLS